MPLFFLNAALPHPFIPIAAIALKTYFYMDKIIIEGGHPLKGTVKISGSKNAALPLMAATLLTPEKTIFTNIPDLADIKTMAKLLAGLGVEATFGRQSVELEAKKITCNEAPYDLVRTMRASVLVLGPLLARTGLARVSLPGGCAIGARPIDRHLKALEIMGATIKLEGGYVEAQAKKLKGARILFDDITVTGTENIMMAATLAQGTTILENSSQEPEVVDLANALIAMGASVEGAGTSTITIQGVEALQGTKYAIMADRIEAGTFMMAASLLEGNVKIEGISADHLTALIAKLTEAGVKIQSSHSVICVEGPKQIQSTDVATQPHPGFATDFQAQFIALMSLAQGTSLVTENIFENRFMHVGELIRMGADIKREGKTAIVRGVPELLAAPVMATDLRASACLVLAGLKAYGITEIHRVYHIDRGYEHIEKKLRALGARIKRAKVKY